MLDGLRDRLAKAIAPAGYGSPGPLSAIESQAVAARSIDMAALSAGLGGPGVVSSLGPGIPIGPAHPEEVEPRRFDYPVGYNVQTRPRAYEPITFETLKALGRNYDIAALAREKRIDDFRRLDWVIRPKKIEGEKRDERLARQKRLAGSINEVTGFWQSPDQQRQWGAWVYAYLDGVFLIDAPTLYLRMTKGGDLFSVEVVDGATILPLIDLWGRIPAPPMAAYRQIIKGMPWTFHDRMVLADNETTFSKSTMSYDPFWPHADSLYGHPPTEWIIIAVNRALRRQTIDLASFTDGSLPEALYAVPEGWTDKQIQELQTLWDGLLGGNDAERVKLRFVPGGNGAQMIPIHPEPKSEVEEWLMQVACGAYGVSPMELGFTIKSSGLGGKGFAEEQARTSNDRNIVLAHHFETIATKILNGPQKQPELEFVFPQLLETEDAATAATVAKQYWDMGVWSSDYIATEKLDLDPPGLGPTVNSPGKGVVLVDQINNPPAPPPMLPPGASPNPTSDAGKPDRTPQAPNAMPGASLAGEPATKVRLASLVLRQLRRQYPDELLGWVTKATWEYRPAVALSDIDYARRPGGRNAGNVDRMADDMRQTGTTNPIVLVDTGDKKLAIADGWHRALAADHAGKEFIPAYVGSGAGRSGPWDNEMLDDAYRKFVANGLHPQTEPASPQEELARWQRKALRAVKLGKSASVPFESEVVAGTTADEIGLALSQAHNADEVRAAFVGPLAKAGAPARPFAPSGNKPKTE